MARRRTDRVTDSPVLKTAVMPVKEAADDWLTRALGARAPFLQFYAVSDEARRAAEAWAPRPSDVIVATYTKCGTTLLQQLIEMLRSRGDMSTRSATAKVQGKP